MVETVFWSSLAFSVASLTVGYIIGKAVLENFFETHALLQSEKEKGTTLLEDRGGPLFDKPVQWYFGRSFWARSVDGFESGSSNKGDSPLNGGPLSDLRQSEGALSHLFNFSRERLRDLSTIKLAQVTQGGNAPSTISEANARNWYCWGLTSRIVVKFPGLYSLSVFLWRWLSMFASAVSFLTALSLLAAFTNFGGLEFSIEGLSLDNEQVSEAISYSLVGGSAFCASVDLLKKYMLAIRVVKSAWRRRALYVVVVVGVVLFGVYFWFLGGLLPGVWASLRSGLG